MNKRALLVISPTHRDRRELVKQRAHSFIFDEYSSEELEKYTYEEAELPLESEDMRHTLATLYERYKETPLAGIVSTDDYPGSIVASVLAKKLGLAGPEPQALLTCQHKYYSRMAQMQAVPEAVPRFELISRDQNIAPTIPFPCFLKPVKSYFSCFAQPIYSLQQLIDTIPRALPHPAFLEPLNQLLKDHSSFELSANYLLAEELLGGVQATIEGYVCNGKVCFMGVVDSIMYPGTISFKQFLYPSTLPEAVQKRAEDMASRCMKHIGFDNGIFNIEFFYNEQTERLHIIEINPRMASQFADLYEKVDGLNTYEVAVDIALGRMPQAKKSLGAYKVAASCVLREFANKRVKRVPTKAAIDQVEALYPGSRVEVLVREGKCLSEELQDGKSYRYGLIQLGAKSPTELEMHYQHCLSILDFQFD